MELRHGGPKAVSVYGVKCLFKINKVGIQGPFIDLFQNIPEDEYLILCLSNAGLFFP
jgi:hypothetical protein